jgi:hypothetical protein
VSAAVGVLRKLIAARAEPWKLRHDKVMKECDAFPQILADRIATFHLIAEIDKTWNADVARNLIPYSAADEAEIADYYRVWLSGAERIGQELDKYQKAGVPFEQADEFRKSLSLAKGALKTDAEFFGEEKLAAMRDEAIDAHRRGESVEMAEFGD